MFLLVFEGFYFEAASLGANGMFIYIHIYVYILRAFAIAVFLKQSFRHKWNRAVIGVLEYGWHSFQFDVESFASGLATKPRLRNA